MNQKQDFITFRVSKSERFVLENMAIIEGQNLSEMVRTLIREGARQRGLPAVGLMAPTQRPHEIQGVQNDN